MAALRITNIKLIILYFFVSCLAWISFFPQSFHNKYYLYTKLVLAGFFFLLLIRKRSIRFLLNREDLFLWLFLGWNVVSVFFAFDGSAAWKRCIDFIIPAITLYFIFKENSRADKLNTVLYTVFLAGAIVSIIGILEFSYKRNIIYEYFFQNEYYHIYLRQSRIMSTMMVPAVLGTYLMCCLTVSYYIIAITENRIYKFLVLIGSFFILIAILLTFTRATWFAVLITAIFYFYNNKKILTVFIVFIFLLLGVLGLARLNPAINNRVRPDKVIDYLVHGHRLKRFPLTAKMIREHPFVGVGPNNYRIVFDKYCGADKEGDYSLKIPDNMYLMILGESGIVGLGLFILFIAGLIKRYLRAIKDKYREQRLLMLALFSILLGFLIHMLSYDLFYWTTPLFLFFMFLGMLSGQSNHERKCNATCF